MKGREGTQAWEWMGPPSGEAEPASGRGRVAAVGRVAAEACPGRGYPHTAALTFTLAGVQF